MVKELQDYGIIVQVFDPLLNAHETKEEYDIDVITNEGQLISAHAILLAVPHQYFISKDWTYFTNLLEDKSGAVIDVKAKLNRDTVPHGVTLWRL
jgi:UDP-N-acetyl-D-galactosamine dehydrogenase